MSDKTLAPQEQLELVKSLNFYQKIDLPDGSTTNGTADHRRDPQKLDFDRKLIAGKTVLDVAANDGFWSFWAEEQGAARTLGIDIDRYEDYDWGIRGVPSGMKNQPPKDSNFFELKRLFESNVERQHLSVYDLKPEVHGTFDLTICYGLLYHLRHPLLAIDKLRAITTGALVLKTHTVLSQRELPSSLFFLDDVFDRSMTNWTGATEACVVHWMRDAGFDNVFVEKHHVEKIDRRVNNKIYVGCISPEFTERLSSNRRFRLCDDSYFRRSRQAVERTLYSPEGASPLVVAAAKLKRGFRAAAARFSNR